MLAVDGLGEVFFCHATPHNDTDFFTDATPRSGGAYVNMMMEEGDDRVRASYKDNYPRLAQIKAHYDPDNLFRVNQNIAP
jgi:FAD/FMN-containing dehydrogenase